MDHFSSQIEGHLCLSNTDKTSIYEELFAVINGIKTTCDDLSPQAFNVELSKLCAPNIQFRHFMVGLICKTSVRNTGTTLKFNLDDMLGRLFDYFITETKDPSINAKVRIEKGNCLAFFANKLKGEELEAEKKKKEFNAAEMKRLADIDADNKKAFMAAEMKRMQEVEAENKRIAAENEKKASNETEKKRITDNEAEFSKEKPSFSTKFSSIEKKDTLYMSEEDDEDNYNYSFEDEAENEVSNQLTESEKALFSPVRKADAAAKVVEECKIAAIVSGVGGGNEDNSLANSHEYEDYLFDEFESSKENLDMNHILSLPKDMGGNKRTPTNANKGGVSTLSPAGSGGTNAPKERKESSEMISKQDDLITEQSTEKNNDAVIKKKSEFNDNNTDSDQEEENDKFVSWNSLEFRRESSAVLHHVLGRQVGDDRKEALPSIGSGDSDLTMTPISNMVLQSLSKNANLDIIQKSVNEKYSASKKLEQLTPKPGSFKRDEDREEMEDISFRRKSIMFLSKTGVVDSRKIQEEEDKERVAKELEAKEKAGAIERERLERESKENEKLNKERRERELKELMERIEKEKIEKARIEDQRIEKEKIEKEKLEKEKLEKEKLEKEKLEKEKLGNDRWVVGVGKDLLATYDASYSDEVYEDDADPSDHTSGTSGLRVAGILDKENEKGYQTHDKSATSQIKNIADLSVILNSIQDPLNEDEYGDEYGDDFEFDGAANQVPATLNTPPPAPKSPNYSIPHAQATIGVDNNSSSNSSSSSSGIANSVVIVEAPSVELTLPLPQPSSSSSSSSSTPSSIIPSSIAILAPLSESSKNINRPRHLSAADVPRIDKGVANTKAASIATPNALDNSVETNFVLVPVINGTTTDVGIRTVGSGTASSIRSRPRSAIEGSKEKAKMAKEFDKVAKVAKFETGKTDGTVEKTNPADEVNRPIPINKDCPHDFKPIDGIKVLSKRSSAALRVVQECDIFWRNRLKESFLQLKDDLLTVHRRDINRCKQQHKNIRLSSAHINLQKQCEEAIKNEKLSIDDSTYLKCKAFLDYQVSTHETNLNNLVTKFKYIHIDENERLSQSIFEPFKRLDRFRALFEDRIKISVDRANSVYDRMIRLSNGGLGEKQISNEMNRMRQEKAAELAIVAIRASIYELGEVCKQIRDVYQSVDAEGPFEVSLYPRLQGQLLKDKNIYPKDKKKKRLKRSKSASAVAGGDQKYSESSEPPLESTVAVNSVQSILEDNACDNNKSSVSTDREVLARNIQSASKTKLRLYKSMQTSHSNPLFATSQTLHKTKQGAVSNKNEANKDSLDVPERKFISAVELQKLDLERKLKISNSNFIGISTEYEDDILFEDDNDDYFAGDDISIDSNGKIKFTSTPALEAFANSEIMAQMDESENFSKSKKKRRKAPNKTTFLGAVEEEEKARPIDPKLLNDKDLVDVKNVSLKVALRDFGNIREDPIRATIFFCSNCEKSYPGEGKLVPSTASMEPKAIESFRKKQNELLLKAAKFDNLDKHQKKQIKERLLRQQQSGHKPGDNKIFCSWVCMKRWVLEHMPITFRYHTCMLIDLNAGRAVDI